MSLSLDHIVIRVKDLERTIADFHSLGFTVQRGGTHADGATHNALIGLADGSYFELIAFLQDAPQHRWWDAGDRVGDGFADFALLPRSVAATIEAAQGRGVRYEGPIDGGRIRPDGARLAWQIGKPATPDLPFLCGDLTPRDLRVAPGEVRTHRNGVLGVSSLSIAVRDLPASVARYRALLGDSLEVNAGNLAGYGVAFASLPLGETTVTLLAPSGDDARSTLAHDLREQLATRGEGVFGVTLRTQDKAFARALPLEGTHGARLEIVAT
ncbi:VOC family protein [Paraburkholderia bryophila]|uniref:Glyoxalase-like protein n=1 Tax=Paraburkholderia bryophila TaxID=420952 RepID=A0A329BWX7_9BURK|nr:VOC family protein [Paraburkholderia bryophila]RAS26370.1 glyoxalase-like protein [Paraburkholderia bryophila]